MLHRRCPDKHRQPKEQQEQRFNLRLRVCRCRQRWLRCRCLRLAIENRERTTVFAALSIVILRGLCGLRCGRQADQQAETRRHREFLQGVLDRYTHWEPPSVLFWAAHGDTQFTRPAGGAVVIRQNISLRGHETFCYLIILFFLGPANRWDFRCFLSCSIPRWDHPG